jgi:hypothetical protein
MRGAPLTTWSLGRFHHHHVEEARGAFPRFARARVQDRIVKGAGLVEAWEMQHDQPSPRANHHPVSSSSACRGNSGAAQAEVERRSPWSLQKLGERETRPVGLVFGRLVRARSAHTTSPGAWHVYLRNVRRTCPLRRDLALRQGANFTADVCVPRDRARLLRAVDATNPH